jgi:hypothetical protein
MRCRLLPYFVFSLLLAVLILLPSSMVQAQDLCTFDPNIMQGPVPPPPPQGDPTVFQVEARQQGRSIYGGRSALRPGGVESQP